MTTADKRCEDDQTPVVVEEMDEEDEDVLIVDDERQRRNDEDIDDDIDDDEDDELDDDDDDLDDESISRGGGSNDRSVMSSQSRNNCHQTLHNSMPHNNNGQQGPQYIDSMPRRLPPLRVGSSFNASDDVILPVRSSRYHPPKVGRSLNGNLIKCSPPGIRFPNPGIRPPPMPQQQPSRWSQPTTSRPAGNTNSADLPIIRPVRSTSQGPQQVQPSAPSRPMPKRAMRSCDCAACTLAGVDNHFGLHNWSYGPPPFGRPPAEGYSSSNLRRQPTWPVPPSG